MQEEIQRLEQLIREAISAGDEQGADALLQRLRALRGQ
jgi:hypothetical protein